MDVTTSKTQIKLTFGLAESSTSNVIEERILTLDVDSITDTAAFKSRLSDFKRDYFSEFNKEENGSLMQKNGWLDENEADPPLICQTIDCKIITTQTTEFDAI